MNSSNYTVKLAEEKKESWKPPFHFRADGLTGFLAGKLWLRVGLRVKGLGPQPSGMVTSTEPQAWRLRSQGVGHL